MSTTADMLKTLMDKVTALADQVNEQSQALADSRAETRALAEQVTRAGAATMPTAPQSLGQVQIPTAPTTAPAHRSTANCKPPKEPTLTGDKQHEWLEFEREFLRYFRITQGYYLEPEVQVDLLLATAGERVRKVFYQLPLQEEEAKDLHTVITAIRKAFTEQQSTVVNKYLFMKIRRDTGEELDSFITRLRESARRCAFVDEDQRVLEQLIFSTVDNVEVLKRMVKDSPPTLNEVIRILKADEVATQEMDRMVGRSANIHTVRHDRLQQQTPRKNNSGRDRTGMERGGSCKNCIFIHSSTDQCPAINMECFYCQKKGHMIAKCRKRQAAGGANQRPASTHHNTTRSGHKNVHDIEQVDDPDESDTDSVAVDNIFIGSLSCEDKESWQTAIRICNKLVNCKIDTGAEVNVMPQRVYNQLRNKPNLSATRTTLRTVAGQIKPLGVMEAAIQYKKKTSVAKFFIVDDSTPTLCGLQTSVDLGLVKKLFQ